MLDKHLKNTGRTFLTIVEGYRESDTGKAKQKTVIGIGYLQVRILTTIEREKAVEKRNLFKGFFKYFRI